MENKLNPSDYNWLRLAHNFLLEKTGGNYAPNDLALLNEYLSRVFDPSFRNKPKSKVGILLVCINDHYWEFLPPVLQDIKNFMLPGHNVQALVWSDLPEHTDDKYFEDYHKKGMEFTMQTLPEDKARQEVDFRTLTTRNSIRAIQEDKKITVFPTETIEWPYPTLLRYNLFLQQEELLKEYDYLFYLDIDMRVVNVVGDEILGKGLTAAPHPGYYIRKELYPPYEPNDKSASYIKRPGKVVTMDGKPRFMPFYAAGGFQGGKADKFIKAMKETAKIIDKDLLKGYIPIWNDESAWNKFLFDVQTKEEIEETIFLDPSYVYPDSLINEYYVKLWGRNFPPKIVTLTKKFSLNKQSADELATKIATM